MMFVYISNNAYENIPSVIQSNTVIEVSDHSELVWDIMAVFMLHAENLHRRKIEAVTNLYPCHQIHQFQLEKKDVCNVCLSKYDERAVVRTFDCGHYFHQTCIDKWIEHNPTCPVCRTCVIPKTP